MQQMEGSGLQAFEVGEADWLSDDSDEDTQSLKQRTAGLEEQVAELTDELKMVYTELKDAQLRVYAHEKLACLGEMTTGIAHEINNPLMYVLFNLSSCEDELGVLSTCMSTLDTATLQEGKRTIGDAVEHCQSALNDSLDGIERIQEIVRNLKEFAYDRPPMLEYFDICRNIETSLKLVWNEIKHKVTVVKTFGEHPRLLGYPRQMNQVFINLFVNAAQAISGMGELRIITREADGYVWIDVADTGTGIPEAIQERIFDSFFTTKPIGEGTGLGLGMVQQIVKRHGGKLTFESEEGKGTMFSIGIPVCNSMLEEQFAQQRKERGYV